jgi:hypothetical protein
MSRTISALLCLIVVTNGQQYQGILINGRFGGTQTYDPFNSPHAQGNLNLGLDTGTGNYQGAAVINGPLAYFASGSNGIFSLHHILKIHQFLAAFFQQKIQ